MKGRLYHSFTDEELKIKMLPNKINYWKVYYWKYPNIYIAVGVFQVLICVQLFSDPMDCSTPGFPVLHHLPEFAQTHAHWVGDAIQPSHPLSSLFLLPSIFPITRVFSNESVLHIRWPKYWSFSFSISPSNECLGLISFRIDWFDLFASKGLSRVFSNTTVQKHQFFGTQLSLWSNSHILTWLLEKPQLWLHRPLSAN